MQKVKRSPTASPQNKEIKSQPASTNSKLCTQMEKGKGKKKVNTS
jgi:hypothetical protein